MTNTLPNFPLFSNALGYASNEDQIAIDDVRLNTSFTYKQLVLAISALKAELLEDKSDLNGERIAILCPSGFAYVVSLWAVWAAGGIAVPLCTSHPAPEQVYNLEEAQVSFMIGHTVFEQRINELVSTTKLPYLLLTDRHFENVSNNTLPTLVERNMDDSALIIFTSGTTGKPKGAVTTHRNIDAQTSVLVKAWYWSSEDRIHHILPLHHVHGIVNALMCPLYIGATVEMHQKFDPKEVWTRWLDTLVEEKPRLTTFMSVPTVYAKLVQYYKTKISDEFKSQYTQACKQFRFMVSGSASLPTPLRNAWRLLSGGQVLLERYGMTEIGMGLSQEYFIWERVEGTVGIPLPGVQTRIMTETVEGSGVLDRDVTELRNVPGALQIKGDNVFKEYYNRPEATKKEFTEDGWFKTGDVAVRVSQHGYYQIMGRNSIDIIKTGGEKVSALEIERELLSCDFGILDVAVVGIPDPEWGQKVSAVVVMEDGKDLDLITVRTKLKTRLAVYKVPSQLKLVSELPKNAMGKVTKKELITLF